MNASTKNYLDNRHKVVYNIGSQKERVAYAPHPTYK